MQRGIDAYIKKKKLDNLESYVPALLVAQGQLADVPLVAEQVDLTTARKLIREGAFVGIRDNVRAVGEYAEPVIGTAETKARLTAFFRSLEKVDGSLFLVRTLYLQVIMMYR